MQEVVTIIYETKVFAKLSRKLLGNEERVKLFDYLKQHPRKGDVIVGSGGIRKLRWKKPGIGKRGGVRVIYYVMNEHGLISLLTVYAKGDKENISKKELKEYRHFIKMIKAELDRG